MITINRPAVLAEFVERLDDAVRSAGNDLATAEAVAAALAPFLGRPGLPTREQEAGDPTGSAPTCCTSRTTGRTRWSPRCGGRQRTPIHDHVAWCVVGVHRGEEHEVRYRMVSDEIGDHLVEDGHTIGARGR